MQILSTILWGSFFTLLTVSFEAQNLKYFLKSNLSVFLFVHLFLVTLLSFPRNHRQMQGHKAFALFSPKNFIVLGLPVRFLIHFELIFIYDIK